MLMINAELQLVVRNEIRETLFLLEVRTGRIFSARTVQ